MARAVTAPPGGDGTGPDVAVCNCPETDPLVRASTYTVARLGMEPHNVACPRWGMTADDAQPTAPDVLAELERLHVSDYDRYRPECRGCRADCAYCEGEHPFPCTVVRLVAAVRAVQALAKELRVPALDMGLYGDGWNAGRADAAEAIDAALAGAQTEEARP